MNRNKRLASYTSERSKRRGQGSSKGRGRLFTSRGRGTGFAGPQAQLPPRGEESYAKRATVGANLLYAGLTDGGSCLQLAFDTGSQLPEVRLCGGGNRNGIALLGHGHRVLLNACDTELQMQMRAG